MYRMLKISFNAPTRKFDNDLQLHSKIINFLKKGPYINGNELLNFEFNFADFIGGKFCIGVSSGTAALELAIASLNLSKDSEILMTANAGAYGSIAAVKANVIPKYFDVDQNGQACYKSFTDSINSKTGAVILTHLYGQAVDVQPLIALCKSRGIFIIEDCSHSIGASYPNSRKLTGSLGDVSTFSFYPTKNLSTFGDAGAIVTSNHALADHIQKLRTYGWSQKYYAVLERGFNYRMDDLHALAVNHQLTSLINFNQKRVSILRQYQDSGFQSGIKFLGKFDNTNSGHLAVIKSEKRDELKNYFESNGIETAIHYPYPDYSQPAFSKFKDKSLPQTENHCNSILSIPLYSDLNNKELQYILDLLSSFKS